MKIPSHKRILSGSAIVSFGLHLAALIFMQSHSIWLGNPIVRSPTAALEKKEFNQILKESFVAPRKTAEGPQKAAPQQEPTPALAEATHLLPLFAPLPLQNFFATNELHLPTLTLPERPLTNLFEHLPKELSIPQMLRAEEFHHLPTPLSPEFQIASAPPVVVQEPPLKVPQIETLVSIPAFTEKATLVKPPAPKLAPLPQLPTLADLQTINVSPYFEEEISFSPNEGGEGYLFAITLIPKDDLELSKLKQHYTFLIDRSNSIQKDRLQAMKTSVLKALEELDGEDTFNLFVFDSKAEKLSSTALPASSASIAQAEGFLERVDLGSFFSSANLDRPLMLTVPGRVAEDEVHTAILMTDGETLAKRGEQTALLSHWTSFNQGKVTLFPLAMITDGHLATLELAAKSNKGRLVCAPTQRGLKRKLLKLMRSVHSPVAKNIACRAVSPTKEQHVDLYPKPFEAPHLYLDQPYTLIGHTDRLEDFVLFVQGRTKGGWINIKKTVSFANARKGGKSLKAEWALQSAHNLYEEYLRDQNPVHLAQARELLAPYDYQIAFE